MNVVSGFYDIDLTIQMQLHIGSTMNPIFVFIYFFIEKSFSQLEFRIQLFLLCKFSPNQKKRRLQPQYKFQIVLPSAPLCIVDGVECTARKKSGMASRL